MTNFDTILIQLHALEMKGGFVGSRCSFNTPSCFCTMFFLTPHISPSTLHPCRIFSLQVVTPALGLLNQSRWG